jgi:hypothetical protein
MPCSAYAMYLGYETAAGEKLHNAEAKNCFGFVRLSDLADGSSR